jgi:(p)ppGpp synthase/HD superfamily hydrolase
MKEQARTQFEKDHAALKNYLLGRGYHQALTALGYANNHHTGFRKDGFTPEFHHQVRIAFSVLTLRDVTNEELCVTLSFLHDTPEDKNVSHAALCKLFGEEVATKACILDKNQHATEEACMAAIAQDSECSIVKGADNGDNVQSMVGVFSKEKIASYIMRTQTSILPMLKIAASLHPEQTFAYAGLRSRLKDQIKLYTNLCL